MHLLGKLKRKCPDACGTGTPAGACFLKKDTLAQAGVPFDFAQVRLCATRSWVGLQIHQLTQPLRP